MDLNFCLGFLFADSGLCLPAERKGNSYLPNGGRVAFYQPLTEPNNRGLGVAEGRRPEAEARDAQYALCWMPVAGAGAEEAS